MVAAVITAEADSASSKESQEELSAVQIAALISHCMDTTAISETMGPCLTKLQTNV